MKSAVTNVRTGWWCVAVISVLVAPLGLGAQQEGAQEEVRTLRRAAALEARGRYEEAREVLEGLLERRPGSSGALFALERVLRPVGEIRRILPHTDRFLELRPRSAGARYLKLRVLEEVDSTEALEPAVRAWVAAEPASPEPYREGARVLEENLGPEEALALLREGRSVVESSTVLAAELGDLLLRTGDQRAAMVAWSQAIGDDGSGVPSILRRLEEVRGEPSEVVGPLLDALDRPPTTPGRRRAGVRVALEVGSGDRALELARKVAVSLDRTPLRGFLTDLVRDGDEAGLPRVSLWALEELREVAVDEREARSVDVRIATEALAAGDTMVALDAQRRVARSLPPRSAERRKVLADLIVVEAGRADAETLFQRLQGFRDEYPGAPELDRLASAVAQGLRVRGHGSEAVRVLEGVDGPRSSLERAHLLFEEGAYEEGRGALMASLAGLAPSQATEVIQLVSLLDRTGPEAAAVVARSAALAHRNAAGAALAEIEGALPGLPEGDRPAVLAHAARVAEGAGRPEDAARLRERLLSDHPEAPETGEATVALARYAAETTEGVSRAIELLERLILERPDSPVVPAARRELERLRNRVGAEPAEPGDRESAR